MRHLRTESLVTERRFDDTKTAVLVLCDLTAERAKVAIDLEELDVQLEVVVQYICGANDLQDVELYDPNHPTKGPGLVSRAFVDAHAPRIGQLQWRDLSRRFRGQGERRGNVNRARWGSGGLIADDLFMTAAHCFARYPVHFEVPSRDGVPISQSDIAKLMKVNFNYQIDGTSTSTPKALRTEVSYPVVELVEIDESIDYAIVRLGKSTSGDLPGETFGKLTVAATDGKPGDIACIIQHPNRDAKKVESGRLKEVAQGQITYDDIDTGWGASGAPVLSRAGKVIGIHTFGGCYRDGGLNRGVSISAIRAVSNLL